MKMENKPRHSNGGKAFQLLFINFPPARRACAHRSAQKMKTFESVENHELEGMVFVIPTEFGGRKSAVHSGYRGQFFWHINNERCSDWLAESYFENDLVEPGQSARIKIKLAGTISELGKKTGMPSGRQFGLREGSRIVAVGVISKSQYEEAEQASSSDGGQRPN